MVEINDGHFRFSGLPVDIVSEICFALTALLADAPEDVRPSLKKIMERCFGRAVTDASIEDFLNNEKEYMKALASDNRQYSIFAILSELQEKLQEKLQEMKEEIAQEEEEENECE